MESELKIIEILTSATAGFILSCVWIFTQLLKQFVTERFVPLLGFIIGAGLTVLIFGFQINVIIPAILIGGAGLGLYDLGKKTILGK